MKGLKITYYYPSGLTRIKLLLKMLWVNFLWHLTYPYGYCDGWNWTTCKGMKNKDCPCIKYNIHCSHIIDIYNPRFDKEIKEGSYNDQENQ